MGDCCKQDIQPDKQADKYAEQSKSKPIHTSDGIQRNQRAWGVRWLGAFRSRRKNAQ